MAVEYWLIGMTARGEQRIRLPVNPESNQYNSPFTYTDYEVEGLGEVTAIGRRGLREFTISSFFPHFYNPTYCEYVNIPDPGYAIQRLEDMRNMRQPIQYIVTGAGGINIKATIRDMQIEPEKAGSPSDIYFTLTIKEFRDVKVTVTAKPTPPAAARPPSTTAPAPVKTYTVVKGDSLWKISARKDIYGAGSKWRTIYNANLKVVGKNPNRIYPGQKLVIPR